MPIVVGTRDLIHDYLGGFVMKRGFGIFCMLFVLGAAPPSKIEHNGMVFSDHWQARQAGQEILNKGGNAVDAAIATVLASGVVQPAGSGLGGGGFAIYRNADGSVLASLDFRERAPKISKQNMYDNASSRDGGLAVAIPMESAGLIELHKRYGSLPLKVIAKPAITLAKKGFVVGNHLEKAFAKIKNPEFNLDFWGETSSPKRGDILKRPRLAKVLQSWVSSKGEVLRTGWAAKDLVESVQANGGILSLEDMDAHQPKIRPVVQGEYRGWKIWSMGPPSSGGTVLIQVLSVLDGYDIQALGHNSSALLHLYAESFQHAFADRAHFMGDPDRVDVPVKELLSQERIDSVRASFDPNQTHEPSVYGAPYDAGMDDGTQHISIIDAQGNSIALTTTINTHFGSKVVGEKSGIVLNNEMDDFVAKPGVPNAYGLVGSYANAVAPGAVPLSSMSPTLLESPDGKTRIAIGASGGPFIISSTLQVIINLIDFGMDPNLAVSVPRMHHQWQPQKLFLDKGFPKDIHLLLQAKGHTTVEMSFYSSVQVVVQKGNVFIGAQDPRKDEYR